MQTIFSIILWVHVAAGLAGLALFWVPLFVKKGGLLHRRVGWLFVIGMGVASLTAVALAGLRLTMNVQRDGQFSLKSIAPALFFVNVAALTLVSVFHGVQVLRQKGRAAPLTPREGNLLVIALPLALLLLSIGSIVVGVMSGSAVLLSLPVVGLLVSLQQLWVLLRKPGHRMFWWYQHMAGMFGGCIAAITATLITNASYVRPYVSLPEWVFWVAPAAIGVPILIIWQNYYKRRFRSAR